MTSPDTLKRLERAVLKAALHCVDRKTGFAYQYCRDNVRCAVINFPAMRTLEMRVEEYRAAHAKGRKAR